MYVHMYVSQMYAYVLCLIYIYLRHTHMHIYTHAWDHQEAAMALTKYQEITDKATRENFIKRFESSGSAKNGGSLKWTINFQKTLTSTDTTEIGSTEDMLTRHGACMSFFVFIYTFLLKVDMDPPFFVIHAEA